MQTMTKIFVLCLFCLALTLVSGCGGAGTLSGTWESKFDSSNTYQFSGKSYTHTYRTYHDYGLGQRMENGTYSFSKDKKKIEFKSSNGKVSDQSFERTENTILLNGDQYTRK